eukprot:11558793-Alexandrium_andersonii.AAC.1
MVQSDSDTIACPMQWWLKNNSGASTSALSGCACTCACVCACAARACACPECVRVCERRVRSHLRECAHVRV